MLRIHRIHGISMQPTLNEGDFVVTNPWIRKARLNTLVLVDHPRFGIIIKRVIGMNSDGSCWLQSENSAGLDTLQMGKINPQHIIGRVLLTIRYTS